MKNVFLSALFFAFAVCGYAQTNTGIIKGRVVDSLTRKPVEGAYMTIYQSGKSDALSQYLTDATGTISATNLAPGSYMMTIILIGYRSYEKDSIKITIQKPAVNLGDILIRSTAQVLKDVTIASMKDVIEEKPDMLIYHADKDITNSGGVALDVLKKAPEVTVDNNGNIELQGNGDVMILINGKTSPGLTGSLTDALQAIPADEIDHIEVMTSPPTKYDAQGMGGIINIVLKKSALRGFTGSVNVAGGTRINKGSGNLSYRAEKWQLSGNLSGNYFIPQPTTSTATRTLTSNDTVYTFNQTGTGTGSRSNFIGGLTFDWDITKVDDLTISGGYKIFSHGLSQNTITATGITQENSVQTVTGYSNLPAIEQAPHASLDYKHTFDTLGQEFDVSINYWGDKNINYNGLSQSLTSSNSPVDANKYLLDELDTNIGLENNLEAGINYAKPFKEDTKLELGAKMTFYTINSYYNYNVLDTLSDQYKYDPVRSNTFIYTQEIPAAYGSFSFKIFSHYTVKAGLRYEYTYNKIGLLTGNVNYNQKYDNLLPSVMIMRKFGSSSLRFTYTYRLERAEYDRLDPLVSISDQNTVSLGNPNMLSEKQQKVDLTYTLTTKRGAAYSATAYYRVQNDDIFPYTALYPTFVTGTDTLHNVSVTEPFNAMTKASLGISAFGSVVLFRNLNIRVNANYTHDHMTILIYSAPPIDAYRYNVNMNIAYYFPNNLVAEAFGMFNSPRYSFQGELPSYSEYSFGLRKQFDHKKASVGLIATNPFNKYRVFITDISGPGLRNKAICKYHYVRLV